MKPLNVGDRVRIAGNPPNYQDVDMHGKAGTVIKGEAILKVKGHEVLVKFDNINCRLWCARRQLTKIVKPKERRRFWININSTLSSSPSYTSKEAADHMASVSRIECVEVLEVKNK